MNVDSNKVIEELLDEIRKLNKDKAIFAAFIKEQNQELKELRKEE